MKHLSEPDIKISNLWWKQQYQILKYGPSAPARFWNLEEMFQKGAERYGKHEEYYYHNEEFLLELVKCVKDENSFEQMWIVNNSCVTFSWDPKYPFSHVMDT